MLRGQGYEFHTVQDWDNYISLQFLIRITRTSDSVIRSVNKLTHRHAHTQKVNWKRADNWEEKRDLCRYDVRMISKKIPISVNVVSN